MIAGVSATHNWPAVGHFFATLTVPALTGVLAAVALALGLGAHHHPPGHRLNSRRRRR